MSLDDMAVECVDRVQRAGSAMVTVGDGDTERFRATVRRIARRASVRIRTTVTDDGTTVVVIAPDHQPTTIQLRALAETMTLNVDVDFEEAVERQRRITIHPITSN